MQGIMPLVLLAAAAYFLLKGQGTAASASPSPSTPTPPPPTGPTAASVLAKLQAAAPGAGFGNGATPWQWNYLLAQVSGINLATAVGDIGTLFQGCGTGVQGGCDTTPISLDQFWAVASPWLKSHGSLSGIGKFPNLLAGNRVRTPQRVIRGWR